MHSAGHFLSMCADNGWQQTGLFACIGESPEWRRVLHWSYSLVRNAPFHLYTVSLTDV